jgi:hypothetical protein
MNAPEMQIERQNKRRSLTSGLWIIAVVAGLMIARDVSNRLSARSSVQPGSSRGDLQLVAESLPQTISDWTRISFTPPENPDTLPSGQYWWVHSWKFQQRDANALVTMDQLGLDHWHELTHCYEGQGWEIEDRRIVESVHEGSTTPWDYVVARMKKPPGEYGLVVFSTFFEDGSPAEALKMGPDHSWEPPEQFRLRVQDRFQIPVPAADHTRALQCQVLCQSTAPFSEDTVAGIIELHKQTRQQFRLAWLKYRNQSSETQELPTVFRNG